MFHANRLHRSDDPVLASRPDDLPHAIEHLEAAVVDPESEEARSRILAFCGEHRDALHRSCLDGHLTGSAFVVDAAGERALLLHHTKLDRWLQPGGHADGDGNLAAVALREAEEETGIVGLQVAMPAIDVDVHTIPERGDEPEHLHLDVRYLLVAPADALVEHNHEALGAKWVGPDDEAVAGSGELERGVNRALTAARELLDRS